MGLLAANGVEREKIKTLQTWLEKNTQQTISASFFFFYFHLDGNVGGAAERSPVEIWVKRLEWSRCAAAGCSVLVVREKVSLRHRPIFRGGCPWESIEWVDCQELVDVSMQQVPFSHRDVLNHPPLDDECSGPFNVVWLAGQGFLEPLPWAVDDGVDRIRILCVKRME